jgi:Domain of unknown function (DUF4192)
VTPSVLHRWRGAVLRTGVGNWAGSCRSCVKNLHSTVRQIGGTTHDPVPRGATNPRTVSAATGSSRRSRPPCRRCGLCWRVCCLGRGEPRCWPYWRSAYVRGDGSLAGAAVQAALVDDAEHPMAGMLDTALQDAVRPEEIRELLLPCRPAPAGASPRAGPATQFAKAGTRTPDAMKGRGLRSS